MVTGGTNATAREDPFSALDAIMVPESQIRYPFASIAPANCVTALIIRKLPIELHELYKTLLDEVSLEDRSQLLRLFSWVCFAVEPLTVPEMRHAILIDPQISYNTLQEYKDNQDYAATDKDIENRIIDLSKSLLEIRNLSQQSDRIHTLVQNRQRSRPDSEAVFAKLGTQVKDRFLEALGSGILRVPQIEYESVSDFLVHQNGFRTLSEDGSSMSVAKANAQLASPCIRYMFLDNFMCRPTEPTKQLFETYPFVMHCVMLWLDYVVEAHKPNAKNEDENLEEDIAKLFATLDPSLDCVTRLYQSFSRGKLFENSMSVAHIVCLLGMSSVLRRFLSIKMAHLNSQDNSGWTPLSYAAAIGAPKVATVLLEYDEDDVSVNSQNKLGRSPLSHASEWGHEETVRLLLDRKEVNPDRKDRLGRKHHGVNINSKYNDHWTPLVLAIPRGQEAVVRYLAARPEAYINSWDLNRSTPLMIAADGGHAKIVGLLIERRDVEAIDKNDTSPTDLSIAASKRYPGIAKVLLTCKDLEVNSEILPGEVELKLAQNFKREDVEPLLSHPALVRQMA
ncbi:Ankyrin repeat-containing domain protein [Hyaloscypha variabilis]